MEYRRKRHLPLRIPVMKSANDQCGARTIGWHATHTTVGLCWLVYCDDSDIRLDVLDMRPLGEDNSRFGVIDDIPQEARRVGQLENEKRPACTQSSERGEHIVGAPVHEYTHEAITPYAMVPSDVVGQILGLPVQLGVGQRPRFVLERDGIWRRLGLGDKERHEVFTGVDDGHGDAYRLPPPMRIAIKWIAV